MAVDVARSVGPDREDRRRRMLLAIPFVLLVLAGLLMTSSALYSDVATVTDNTIATGTLDLTATPATQAYAVSDMAPGDVEFSKITLTNSGGLELRHSMLSTTTNDPDGLAAQLELSVAAIADSDPCAVQTDFDAGTALYTGVLGSAGGTAVYGDPAQGDQAGDRTLAGGDAEGLCLRVELPSTTGPSFAGTTTTVDFRFDAEQTANNP